MYMKATLYMDVMPNFLDITDTGGRDDAFAPRCSGMLWKSVKCRAWNLERGGAKMTISERIFERLAQLGMTQKQFSEETGILQSTISEWKKKKTNPTSEKIMVISQVLGVTPEWLLSGIEKNGSRKSKSDWYVVGKDTELGHLINAYNNMSRERRSRLIGYVEAIISLDF